MDASFVLKYTHAHMHTRQTGSRQQLAAPTGVGAHVRPARPGRPAAGLEVRRDRLRRQLLRRRVRAALLPPRVTRTFLGLLGTSSTASCFAGRKRVTAVGATMVGVVVVVVLQGGLLVCFCRRPASMERLDLQQRVFIPTGVAL